jgi:hypothetical protein
MNKTRTQIASLAANLHAYYGFGPYPTQWSDASEGDRRKYESLAVYALKPRLITWRMPMREEALEAFAALIHSNISRSAVGWVSISEAECDEYRQLAKAVVRLRSPFRKEPNLFWM